jgi:3-dehydroquinate synthase class II
MCLVDKYGFPRTTSKSAKRVHCFQTGDMVRLIKTTGKHQGVYVGKVAVRTRGAFDISADGKKISANWKHFMLLQRFDGYGYRYTA